MERPKVMGLSRFSRGLAVSGRPEHQTRRQDHVLVQRQAATASKAALFAPARRWTPMSVDFGCR